MLTYNDKVQATIDTVLGVAPSEFESPEAALFRRSIAADVEKMNQLGIMPDIPCDWDASEPVDAAAATEMLAALEAEDVGHPFRGNQYTNVPASVRDTPFAK
jgi:hypothetical protein